MRICCLPTKLISTYRNKNWLYQISNYNESVSGRKLNYYRIDSEKEGHDLKSKLFLSLNF